MSVVVIGVGNAWRGDDGAGLELAKRLAPIARAGLRVVASEGDQSGLLGAWHGDDDAVIVDAASSGAAPGTVHRFDAAAEPLPVEVLASSTHAFGVPDAVELARSLGRLPRTLTVYAIEGASFEAGEGLTPDVERAVARLAEELAAT